MEYRRFGTSDLTVSVIGFGAWAIGGPAMAAGTPIGWGPTDDAESRRAIVRALASGITFFDTADIYGIGRSERLLGEVIGNRADVVVATKVGQRTGADGRLFADYSPAYIGQACDASLRRLQRDVIDLYLLHTARTAHLRQGECIQAMERLVAAGKVRSWGISLNTFVPGPEADELIASGTGSGAQLVLNVLNRRALPVIERLTRAGYGVVARMPLQFGLLSGRMDEGREFPPDDHRSFRLSSDIIRMTNSLLRPVWDAADADGIDRAVAALSFAVRTPGVSTVIPGIRTAGQADRNAAGAGPLPERVERALGALPAEACEEITKALEARG